jgi:O-antigen ligase
MSASQSIAAATPHSLSAELLCSVAAFALGLAWLIPNHYLPWFAFHGEVVAVVAALCVVALALRKRRGERSGVPSLVIGLAIMAAVPWIQFAAGQVLYLGDALLVSLYVGGVALCAWAAYLDVPDRDRLARAIAGALLWASLISTGIALYQWFGLSGLTIWAIEGVSGARTGGNLAQPNQLATLLVGGIAAAAWARSRRELGAASSTLLVAFLFLGLALTQSRTPWLAFVLLGLWAMTSGVRARQLLPAPAWALACLFAWYAVAYWLVLVLPEPLLLASATGAGEPGRLQVGLRPLLWSQMWEAIAQSPWVGYGWGQGLTAQATAVLIRPGLEYSSYAHNFVLDLMVWNGVPIGLAMVGLVGIWYIAAGRSVKAPDEGFRFCVITAFMAHALVEYPHAYAYFLIPVAVLAGQLEAQRAPVSFVCSRWVLACGAFTAASAVVVVVNDYLPLLDDRRIVQMWLARIGGERQLPPAPNPLVLNQMGVAAKMSRVVPTPDMPPEQLAELARITRRFPTVYFLRRLSAALALNGHSDEAFTELQRLRGLHGDLSYRLAVNDLKELSETARPELQSLLARIEQSERESARSMPTPKR